MICRLLASILVIGVTGLALLNPTTAQPAQLPEERPLWTEADFQNPIHYEVPESVREKEQDKGNDGHGSKVIVIPFDGAALDRDLQSTADLPKP